MIRVRFVAVALSMVFCFVGSSPVHVSAQDLKTANTHSSRRMADGRQWSLSNLSLKTLPFFCYEDQEQSCQKYGALYTWESARRACPALGNGWRLPTDDEWRQLAKLHGGVSEDSEDKGKAAYKALVSGGNSGFHALLGGGRSDDGKYARVEAHGFYWTATETDRGNSIYYNFGRGGLALHRQNGGEKERAFSVRCVRG